MARGFRFFALIFPFLLLACGQGTEKQAEMVPVATAVVKGTVVDSKNESLAGVTIIVAPASSPATTVRTDAKGRFEIIIGADEHKIEIKDGETIIHQSSFISKSNESSDLGVLKPDRLYFSAGTFWYKDADRDGYSDGAKERGKTQPASHRLPTSLKALNGDCDDEKNTVYPGAKEIPGDGIDQDCDGADLSAVVETVYYRDSDKDGFGDKANKKTSATRPDGYVSAAGDCNDADASINPKAKEILNDGVDQDCNGVDAKGTAYYKDADKDGFGDKASMKYVLAKPAGFVLDAADCNDGDSSIYPGAAEALRDGIDQNCDGFDEEGSAFYKDADGDGFGDPGTVQFALVQPAGFVVDSSDCNDADSAVNPGAEEILNDGVDQNCDDFDAEGTAYYRDEDGDGFGDANVSQLAIDQPAGFVADSSDCNDSDKKIHPGAEEILRDGADQDCDGADLEGTAFYRDADADGSGDAGSMLLALSAPEGFVQNSDDCNDGNAAVNPGAEEIPGNEIDENCDGEAIQGEPSLFSDVNLEHCIRETLGLGEAEIEEKALSEIYELDCKNRSISNLDGINLLKNLEWAFLQGNQIEDLSPISTLTSLERIYLQENKITTISSVSGLKALELLNLRGNKVSDLGPLAGLKKLAILDLWGNKVENISALADLPALKELDLWENVVSDISPLAGLAAMEMLTLGGNNISDLAPLAHLTNLKLLSIRKNQISDISSLSSLSRLGAVYLGENCISDFSPLAKVQAEAVHGIDGQRSGCKMQTQQNP